jgi:hypothetical protein
MRHDAYDDVPLVSGTLTIRNPRRVLLLNPFQTPLVICLLLVSVTFTFWPDALEHAPVGFEERGLMHHVWHYALLLGSLTTLVGMLIASPHRMKVELIGLILLVGTMTMNFAAFIEGMSDGHPSANGSGLGLALRLAVILGLTVRILILLRQPTVPLPVDQRQ